MTKLQNNTDQNLEKIVNKPYIYGFSTTIETVERIFQLFIEKYVFNNFPQFFNSFPKHDIWYKKGYKTLQQAIRTNQKLKQRQKNAEGLIKMWELTLSKEC